MSHLYSLRKKFELGFGLKDGKVKSCCMGIEMRSRN